jgi:uncharacterized tellurite resistance protein B-like protein
VSNPQKHAINTNCPSCNAALQFDEKLVGRNVRCPRCRKPFIAPSGKGSDLSDPFPPWLIAYLTLAGLITACLISAFLIGLGRTLFFVFCAATLIAIVWQRKLVTRTAIRLLSAATQAFKGSTSDARRDERELTDSARNWTQLKSGNLKSAARTSDSIWNRSRREGNSGQVQFCGPGTSISLLGMTLDSPLVYLAEGSFDIWFDASLIETSLPVASPGRTEVEGLPYWPSYRNCSPMQRHEYLNWLTVGRRSSDVPIGYVFIYFYGLERRALHDQADAAPILHEVLRLLQLYAKKSNSFLSYASAFLWAAVVANQQTPRINEALVSDLIRATGRWTDESVAALLSWYHSQGRPLAAGLAFEIAKQDPRAPRSIVARRHPEKFEGLFTKRYEKRFGQGLVLKAARSDLLFRYRPASATLPAALNAAYFERRIANIRRLSSQFKPLLELWSEAIDDLKAFDRAGRKSAGPSMTAAMYEALPPELRQDDHPDYPVWCRVIDRYTNNDGWTIVPIAELAQARGISQRPRLTRSQSEELVRTAEAMELSLEPDPRITGLTYRWDDSVSVFPRESESDQNLKSYHAASILLRLGMGVAAADGEVNPCEVERITSQLREQFRLSAQDSVRLDHLSHLLEAHPAADARLASKLTHFPQKERELIGEFLVSIAAADEVVTAEEIRALKKVYRQLGLDAKSLENLTVGRVRTSDQTSDGADHLVLDSRRIRQIMTDTERVAELLSRVMLDDDLESMPASNPTDRLSNPTRPAGEPDVPDAPTPIRRAAAGTEVTANHREKNTLPLHIRRFACVASSKPKWNRRELEQLARQNDIMLSGAVDTINEWSLEHFGDWMFQEEGDALVVNPACVPEEWSLSTT